MYFFTRLPDLHKNIYDFDRKPTEANGKIQRPSLADHISAGQEKLGDF